MAACNASGARSYAYGPMRPHITGLHVALADGDLLELQRGEAFAQGRHLSLVTAEGHTLELDLPGYTMPKTKNASGYFVADDMDAIDLFIGACGTLGVITELEIALQAAPAVVWGVSCFFDSEDKAVSFTDSVRPVLSHAVAIEYFDASALDILRRQREQSTAFASLPVLDKEAKVCVYVELDCDDEAQATEELYHLGWVLELAGGRDDATWVARTEVDRECQRFFRHAVPESVNMLIDERRRMDPTITKLGSDMSVPNARLADVIALYRRTLAESGLESAAWGEHPAARCARLPSRWRTLCPVGFRGHGHGRCRFCRARRRQDQGGLLGDDVRPRGHGRVGASQTPARSCRPAGSRQPVCGEVLGWTRPEGGRVKMSDFHMVVCVKAVPGSTEVKMDPKTNTIVRDGKQAVINPFDASALECALALKDDFIGFGMDVRVTVVSMGIPATESLLRDCIARGVDDALLLTDRAFAGADTLATTYALKCGIEALDEDFDLLICGKMAVDGDTAQIGPELAGAFEIPCVTDVSCVQSAGFTTCGSLALVHGCDAGEETVYLEMPCAMTTAKEIGQLRMPSIAGIRAAEDADVRVASAADVNADPSRCGLAGSPTQVVRSFVPDRDQTCEAVEGTASEQAVKLAKIIEEMA